VHFQHLFTAKRARRRSLGAGSAQESIRHIADHQDRHADAITQFPTPKTCGLCQTRPATIHGIPRLRRRLLHHRRRTRRRRRPHSTLTGAPPTLRSGAPPAGPLLDDVACWPEAADPECPLLRRYRRESGRDADIAKRAFLTRVGRQLICPVPLRAASDGRWYDRSYVPTPTTGLRALRQLIGKWKGRAPFLRSSS
jgi:hypothetical protein